MHYRRVLLIDETATAAELAGAVVEAGCELVGCYGESGNLVSKIESTAPQMILLVVAKPSLGLLKDLGQAMAARPVPVVLFSQEKDCELITQAVKSGVSSYIFKGLDPERIQPIMEMAELRFDEMQSLRSQLKQTQDKLAGRKLVDRAKGMLMDQHRLSEQQAYRALQKTAMDRGMSIHQVAEYTISMLETMGLKRAC